MITHINGKLVEKYPDHVVIETKDGVGYFINISLNTFSSLNGDENCKLYTHLAVREDAHTLYGFSTFEERKMFLLLISVSGVGANTARMILSSLTVQEISEVIVNEDVTALKSVKGIGAKTAQRVIVDLKDKIEKEGIAISSENTIGSNKNKEEALAALMALGFAKNVAEKAIDKTIKSQGKELSVEELIKLALKNF